MSKKKLGAKVISIIVTAFLVLSNFILQSGISYAATNNITNPSFENTTGWSYNNMGRSTDRAHSGAYSIKCTVGSATANSIAITVSPNTSYKLSAWVYKVNGAGDVYIDLNDISGEPQPSTSSSGKWVRISANWYSGSNTSVVVRCCSGASITDAVYFDDITLEENDPDSTFETEEGWSFYSMTRSLDTAKTGNYSLKAAANGLVSNTNIIHVSTYTTYKLSGWVYKSNSTGNAYLDMNDIAGEPQIGAFNGSGGGTWTYASATWNSGTNTQVRVRCITDGGTTAAVYFDDVKLEAIAPDGTFEADTGWTYYNMSRSMDRGHTGAYSLKCSVNGATTTSNAVTVIPNTEYMLSGWIYKTNSVGNAYLDMDDISGEAQIGVYNGSGAGTWTYVVGTWNSGTNSAVKIRCVTDSGITAAVYFDDLKLEAVAPDGTFEGTIGWETYGAMTRSTSQKHGGSYSLSSTANGTAATSNEIPVTPNTRYTLSCWIYKTNNNGNVYMDMDDLKGEVSPGVNIGVGAGVWTRVSRDWFSGNNTFVKIRCVTDGGLTAAVYFDDLSFATAATPVSPNATIVTPAYVTEDIVIKDYDVTNASFGADSTGTNDSTVAIQKALDNCYLQGGGTVWIPAGTYKVSNALYIPSGVFLRGDWRDPDSGSGSYGTMINAYVNAGFGALFNMEGDIGGLYGLTIFYPNQSASSPIDTGWAVVSDDWHNTYIKNLTLLNAYKGIKFGGTTSGGSEACPEVCFVKGTVLNTGMELINGYGAGGAHDIKFDNSYWANAGASYNAPAKSTLDTYTRANGTGFTFGHIEIYNFHHLSAYQYNIGMRYYGGNPNIGTDTWGCNFAFVTLGDCNTALQVDAAAVNRFNVFLRSSLKGSSYSIRNNVTGHTIKVTDCTLVGSTSGSVTVASPGTSPTSYTTQTLPKVTRAVLYDVTKSPYNASYVTNYTRPAAFPYTDATTAIQSALTAAGTAGGGVVYVPAGWYRINGHLTIPANVELRGVSSGKTGAFTGQGSWLCAYEGENTSTPTTDAASVTIDGNGSGINAIQVIWPNNQLATAGSIKAFPYAFRINGVNDAYIINTNFKNPYLGVDIANGSNRHHLRSLYGSFSNNFIRVGTSTEGWIEELYDMNPCPWIGVEEFGGTMPWLKGDDLWPNLVDYEKANSDFIIINGASNEHIMSILTFSPKNLIYVTSGAADIWNAGADQSGSWCVYAPGGTVRIMNSVNTIHGSSVNSGAGIVNSYNEHYVY